jgi:ribosomal protein S18 acetylase RimI-like enzyme
MIRKGTIDDLVRLDALARTVANGLHADGIEQWSDQYPAKKDFADDIGKQGLWVEEENGTVVGSLSLLPDCDEVYRILTWPPGDAWVIHRIMVDPAYRRRGIGTRLMEHAIHQTKAAGLTGIKVDTHPDNRRMQAFLESFGFFKVGYLPPIHRVAYFLRVKE